MNLRTKAFTLIELLVVVAIIGILAAVGVTAYQGYTSEAKYIAVKKNFNTVVRKMEMFAMDCELNGSVKLLSNGSPAGKEKKWVCINQNTNSMANLFIDHFHFKGFKNPLTGYSATWWFGTPVGAALKNKDGYILFDGNPTNQCLVKITTTVPNSGVTETLTHNVPFHGRVNGC